MSGPPPEGHLKTPGLGSLATTYMGLLFIVGNISNAIYPVFVTAMLDSHRASTENIGVIATAEFLVLGAAILFAGRLLPENRLRLTTGVCLISNLILAYASTKLAFGPLVVCRALYGLSCGVLLWIAYTYISRTSHPSRLIGIYITILMTVGVIASWIVPLLVQPILGPTGVIIFLSSAALVALLALPFAPRALPEVIEAETVSDGRGLPVASLFVLISIAFWAAFMSIFWVYAEPLAGQFTDPVIHYWLTGSLVCQILGAGLAAALAERISYRVALSVGLLLSAVQVASILIGTSAIGFLGWTALYGFLGYFLVPFFITGLVVTDPSRRSVVYFPVAQCLAGSLGPLVVSMFVSEHNLDSGLMIDLIAIAAAPILLWAGILIARKNGAADGQAATVHPDSGGAGLE